MNANAQPQLPTPPPAADAGQRRLAQVLFVDVFMAALDSAIVGLVIPSQRTVSGIDNRTAGLLTTVFALSSVCSTALMAYFSDRHGRRPVYLASVALFAIGSLCILDGRHRVFNDDSYAGVWRQRRARRAGTVGTVAAVAAVAAGAAGAVLNGGLHGGWAAAQSFARAA